MPVEDFNKYMALSKVLNNTWGTGSQLKSQSQSIKFSLRDDKLMKCSFMMIVVMPNNHKLEFEMKTRFRNEALQMIKSASEDLAERFKDQTGKALNLKFIQTSVLDGVEFLSNSQYRPSKPAYFRLDCLYEID